MMNGVNVIVIGFLLVAICGMSDGVKFRKSNTNSPEHNDVLNLKLEWHKKKYHIRKYNKISDSICVRVFFFFVSASDIKRCKVADTECIVETSNKVIDMFYKGNMNV